MSRRGKIKKTSVYRGLFGEKRIETRWVDPGWGCGTTVGVVLFVLLLLRGCV